MPKRYCTEHGNAYLKKRRKYLEIQATLPDCASGIAPNCSGKVGPLRVEQGFDTCGQCGHAAEILEREEVAETTKWTQLADARTIDELKSWIEDYMR